MQRFHFLRGCRAQLLAPRSPPPAGTPWTLVAEAGVSQAEDRFTVWAAGCAPFTPLAEG